jgi:hypothetical protein
MPIGDLALLSSSFREPRPNCWIARFDTCDLRGEFEEERRSCSAKPRSLEAWAEGLGLS